MNYEIYKQIAQAVHAATHGDPLARAGFTERQHANGANGHPAYLAVREVLLPLVKH